MAKETTAEQQRLDEAREHKAHWKRWGPYLSERAWGTVREDYSASGNAWEHLPHDHARSTAYRWNEDGIAGICINVYRVGTLKNRPLDEAPRPKVNKLESEM